MIRLLLEQSDLGLHCLPKPFWQATSCQNFRTCTVKQTFKVLHVCEYEVESVQALVEVSVSRGVSS